MLDAFGFAGGAGGVQQKQRVLGVYPFRFAAFVLTVDGIRPPCVTPFLHRNIVAAAF